MLSMTKYNNTYKGKYNKTTIYKGLISNYFVLTTVNKQNYYNTKICHISYYTYGIGQFVHLLTQFKYSVMFCFIEAFTHNHRTD